MTVYSTYANDYIRIVECSSDVLDMGRENTQLIAHVSHRLKHYPIRNVKEDTACTQWGMFCGMRAVGFAYLG